MCMNPLHFRQSKFLHDEEKIMKSISKPTFKNINRYKDYSQIEYIKKKIEYDSPEYVSSNRVSDSPGGGGVGTPCIKIGYSGFFQEMGSPPPF